MKTAALAVLLFTLGCQTLPPTATTKVWYQSGKTEAEIRKDWAESQLAAQYAFAGMNTQQPIIIGDGFAASYAAGAATAARRDARNDARRIGVLTMQSRGYVLLPLGSVPAGEPYLRP